MAVAGMIKRGRRLEKFGRGLSLLLVLLAMGCAGLPAAPATQTPAPVVQRLRLINQSQIDVSSLVVQFPEMQRIGFGRVPAGATTEYRPVPQGVYRYAAYEVVIDGKTYQQPVIDWVGETPMQGTDFTYLLAVDPGKWESEGWVIQLTQVKKDR